jgi:aspartate kinase
VPLWVKNTFSEHPGTEVVSRESFPGTRVTGVSHTGKLIHVQFDLDCVVDEHKRPFQSRVYETLAQEGISLHMVDLSPGSIGFAVPREQFATVEDLFDGLVVPIVDGGSKIYVVQRKDKPTRASVTQTRLMGSLGDPVEVPYHVTEGATMVSLVGHEYMQQPGVFESVLQTLYQNGVPVTQVSDSDYSLSCLIPEAELRKAVTTLHDRFVVKGSA